MSSKLNKFNAKKTRPLSKADKLRIRQNRLVAQSHPDFLEERRNRRKQFLDEGFEPRFFDDEAEEDGLPRVANVHANNTSGSTTKSRRKRGTAEQQADELFRQIQGDDLLENFGEEEDDQDDEVEHQQMRGEEQDALLQDEEDVGSEADDAFELDEDDDDEDDAPPEEFSSIRPKHFGLEEEEEEEQTREFELDEEINDAEAMGALKRRKLSKRKRDAMKRVEKVAEGKYTVEMGGAQFEVVALAPNSSGGMGQCADGFPPLPPLNRTDEMPMNLRERLLQISTAKKRSKRFRMPMDKRPKLLRH